MSSRYNKLYASVITSSIWVESHETIRVWTAFLAMKDAAGFVSGSVPGMAHICMMSVPEFEAIIAKLSGPDPHSRTPDNDGRRIEAVPGGWKVLNSDYYEADEAGDRRREQVRLAVARHRERRKAALSAGNAYTEPADDDRKPIQTQTQTQPARKGKSVRAKPEGFDEFWADFRAAYPKRGGATMDWPDAEKAALVKLSAGVPYETLVDGAKRYAAHARASGIANSRIVRQPATWLRAAGWEEDHSGSDGDDSRSALADALSEYRQDGGE